MSGLHQQITFATGAPAVHVATTALCRLYSRAFVRLFPAKSILSRWPGASSQGLIPNPPSLISITAAGRTAGQLVESRGGERKRKRDPK